MEPATDKPDKRYRIRFLLPMGENLEYEVPEVDWNRLGDILHQRHSSSIPGFFWFKTAIGRSVAVNLEELHAARLLWDPLWHGLPAREPEEGVLIRLRGREEALQLFTEDLDVLYDFFVNLEHGPDVVLYPHLIDDGGERVVIRASEVIWASAPTDLLDEGEAMVVRKDGLVD
jgi:hypothetical protein